MSGHNKQEEQVFYEEEASSTDVTIWLPSQHFQSLLAFLFLLTAKRLSRLLWDVSVPQRFILVGEGGVSARVYTKHQDRQAFTSDILTFPELKANAANSEQVGS